MRPADGGDVGNPDLTGQPLEITTRRDGDSVTIALDGELDLVTGTKLDAAIRDAEESEIGAIVLDLSELSFVDSTGLKFLLEADARNRADGNRLTFVPPEHPGVKKLLAVTGTTKLFE
jgi:anti-sigma B factor antagonist